MHRKILQTKEVITKGDIYKTAQLVEEYLPDEYYKAYAVYVDGICMYYWRSKDIDLAYKKAESYYENCDDYLL